MTNKLRIALAQLNFKVGDIHANLTKHLQAINHAKDELHADLIVFPELSLTGYPPEDLLLRSKFIEDVKEALQQLINEVKGIYCVVGHPFHQQSFLYNACSIVHNQKVIGRYYKQRLPNYGVFDECRYFNPGKKSCVFSIKDIPIGLVICEDLWKIGPTHETAAEGARLIIIPNASPFEVDKHAQRFSLLAKRATSDNIPIAYVNTIGGQDDLVFDGGSMVVDEAGNLCQFGGFFKESILSFDLQISDKNIAIKKNQIVVPEKIENIYQALVLSVRDYVEKNHFPGVLLGLSGGIDSALVLAIAVDALGKDKVKAIMMPSRFTADMSNEDAKTLIAALDVQSETISIEPVYQLFLNELKPSFAEKKPDITEENIQARVRAIILMALSNKFGQLVLTTSNRSEMAVGYSTLYGDMAGGFAVLKDIPKLMVYELARYRNKVNFVIPNRIIDRPPSAELAANQKDEDSLPPYSILDKILEGYLDYSQSIDDLIANGFEPNTVKKVVNLIYKSEYKRRQAPIGPHINHKSFGKDWRYPITNGFKESQ